MNNKDNPVLAIIVPCFNEEEVLEITIKELSDVLNDLIAQHKISAASYLMFVDDGSKDKTWEYIVQFSMDNSFVKALKLSRNFGHQYALWGGLDKVKDTCDCCIAIR